TDVTETGDHLAACAEGGVKAAVTVITHQREVGELVDWNNGVPPAMIFPSGCKATEVAPLNRPPKSVVVLPPEPKVVSGVPLALNQNPAKSKPSVGLAPPPAATILPSGCKAIRPPKSLSTFPPVPK